MIAFVLTLLYSALNLLSPFVLPEAIVQLHIAEILGVLTIASAAMYLGQAKLGSLTETYFALGIVVTAAFSILATGWVGGVLQFILSFLPIIFNFFFIVLSCRSLPRLRIFVLVLLLTAFFILGHGVLALFTGNFSSVYLEQEGSGDLAIYRLRGLGVLNDPNDLAQFFVMILPLLWLRWSKNQAANLAFTLVPAGLLLYGIYLTHSRGGMIAVVAVLLFGFRRKLGLIGSGILTAVALVGMVTLNVSGNRGMTEDDGGRVAAWATGLEVFKAHPLLGVGVGNFGNYNSTGLTAHNSYVLGLAESGFTGYFCWIGLIVCVWMGLQQILLKAGSRVVQGGAEMSIDLAEQEPVTQTAMQSLPVAPDNPWQLPEAAEAVEETTPAPEEELVFSARVVQISMVGLLTASFFLSRTYCMPLFILLGLAVALKTLSHPPVQLARGLLFNRAGMVVLASILFLYLFVRLRGTG